MSDQNAENAKIFLNLEDSPETMQSMGDEANANEFAQDEPMVPQRPQGASTGSGGVASGPAIIGLIAILGGGSIFGMRVVSNHAAIAADAFEIDYSESVIGADFNQRFEASMLNLERSARPMQVPLTYIARDPFNFSEQEGIRVVEVEDPNAKTAEEIAAERERIKEQLRIAKLDRERSEAMINAADGYELQSTLQGSNPVARISGEIVRLGGTLRYEIVHEDAENETAEFTVESIGGRSAVLVGPDGSRYELQIGLPTQELAPLKPETPAEPETDEAPVQDGSFFQGLMERLNSGVPEQASDVVETEGSTETETEAETGTGAESETAAEAEVEAAPAAIETPTVETTESTEEEAVEETVADPAPETESEAAEDSASDTEPAAAGDEAEAESEADTHETDAEASSEDAETEDVTEAEADTEPVDSDVPTTEEVEEPEAVEDTSEDTDDGAADSDDGEAAPTEDGH